MSIKVIGGAMAGVFVPIAVEFAAQGADISADISIKWSGVVGIVVGAVPIAAAVAKVGPFRSMREDNKYAIISFGAASLATGISILILQQLRKGGGYTFGRGGMSMLPPPAMNGLAQQYTAPVGEVIKEI